MSEQPNPDYRFDSSKRTNEEAAADATTPLRRRQENLLRSESLTRKRTESEPDPVGQAVDTKFLADYQAEAKRNAETARKTIANIESDRSVRVAQAESEGRPDTTIYNPDEAHLTAIVTDPEETQLAKEHGKRRPNPDKIADLEDDRTNAEFAARNAYAKNPNIDPEAIRPTKKRWWKRLGGN